MAISLNQLREQLTRREGGAAQPRKAFVSTGARVLDDLLDGGLRRGALVEWLAEVPGHGAASLALACAREVCREHGALVIVDPHRQFYPPAVAGWGIDFRQLIVVHPGNQQELEWAIVQALRSSAVGAVWATLEQIDDRAFRRLQLTAKAADTLGLLLRPVSVRGQPTWSDVQLLVEPLAHYEPRRVRTTAIRCRGGKAKGSVELEVDGVWGKLRDVRHSDDTLGEAWLFAN